MSESGTTDGQANSSTDEKPSKRQRLSDPGERLGRPGGDTEPDDDEPKVSKSRRTYPEPSFDIERAIGGRGRSSYTVETKLNVIEYTRLGCSDGAAVGNRGAANRLSLDPKRVREWVQNEVELRAAKEEKGKASARSLHKGTSPSKEKKEGSNTSKVDKDYKGGQYGSKSTLMSESGTTDGQANNSADKKPSKRQKLSDSGERLSRLGGDAEPDDPGEPKVSRNRRTYPEPSFSVERAIGGRGRSSYTVATKLNVIEYTRLGCSDGAAVGNRGAANRLSLDPKCVREWVQHEVELRAAKEGKGKASARSLHKGTTPSKRKREEKPPAALDCESLVEEASLAGKAGTSRKRVSCASSFIEEMTQPCASNSVRKPALPTTAISFFRRDGAQETDGQEQRRPRHYAVDVEMVDVVGPGEAPERRAMVSVGVVNERLETMLYGRVAVPKGCRVTTGAFARVEGGLWADWDEGMPARCVSEFLARHAASGGVIVGWEVHGDLEVMGFEKAAKCVRNRARELLPLDRIDLDGGGGQGTCCSAGGSDPLPGRDGEAGSDGSHRGRTSCWGVGDGAQDGRMSSSPATFQRRRRKGSVASEEGLEGNTNKVVPTAASNGGGDAPGEGDLARDSPGDIPASTEVEGSAHNETPAGCEAGVAGGEAGGEPGDTMRVVEVTDLFRTMKGLKCTLTEAYGCCFDRIEAGAHNAAVDARMTMELYNLWRRAGEPEQPLGLPLSFFALIFHSFKPGKNRLATLWNILRPEGGGRSIALEKDSGTNTYKVLFRNDRERQAHLALVETRMSSAGLKWGKDREFVPGKNGSKDSYQVSCGAFKMHILEMER